jgi:DNA polymerase-3 subunit alpha
MKIEGFEHLHRHSDFSLLDGYATVEEYASYSKKVNQQYLCISDHGMMGVVPRQIRAADEHGLDAIFACELYVNPNQPDQTAGTTSSDYFKQLVDEDEKKRFRKNYHLLAIAFNNTGYSNLVKLSSWGWTRGFYSRPRVNYEQLNKYKEGIIFTSCCYNSEIGQAFDKGGDEAGFAMVEKYMKMFGENFRLEIMLLDFTKQKPYDVFIIKAHQKYGIPMIVTNDCHYCLAEDSHQQRLMLMIQTQNTLAKIQEQMTAAAAGGEAVDFFELQDSNLWMKSEEELNDKWAKQYSDVIEYDLFAQAKRHTVEICKKAKGVKLDRSIKLPQIDDANDKFMEAIMAGMKTRGLPKTREYLDRIKKEYTLICHKGFSSYFLIQKMMTDEARRVCKQLLGWGTGAEAVGPGRGSAVGALSCYCLGITDVDPIKHDLLFDRFLSPARGGKMRKFRFTIDPIPVDQIEECPFDADN